MGIFVDGVNWAVQHGFAEQVKSITQKVKNFTLLNAFHPTGDRTKLIDGPELLEHADGIFVDSWFRRLCDNTIAAETLVEACLDVPSDKVMILNSWIWETYGGWITNSVMQLIGYSGDADPHSGHVDPSVDFGQKDNFMTILQFFSKTFSL